VALFEPGSNPREHPRHRERGREVLLRVTYDAIAAVTGLAVETVRRHGTGRRAQFNPRNLSSVVSYISQRRKDTTP
jgi:hypothetical protein